jgi:NADH dehydrogenase
VSYEGQVWVVGDCAASTTKSGNRVPPTAQHATRAAKTVARNVTAAMQGGRPRVFDFEGLGKLASLGHHSAVADVLGMRLSGFLAWFLWRTVYLLKMPGLDRKVRIGADWFSALLFPPDQVQLKILTASSIAQQHFEPGEIVFSEGDLGDSVYVIRAGECEVLRETARGPQRLAVLRQGDYFGEMAVLADASRNATVRAISALEVLVISKPMFDMLKANVPAFRDVFQGLADRRAGLD